MAYNIVKEATRIASPAMTKIAEWSGKIGEAAKPAGAFTQIRFWNPKAGAWVTTPYVGALGELIGVRGDFKNTTTYYQMMRLDVTVTLPDDTNVYDKGMEISMPPGATDWDGFTIFMNQLGIYDALLELYGEV